MREVDDPVGLKGRGEETVVLNDHSLHRVLGGHEQGAGAGDIHRRDVVNRLWAAPKLPRLSFNHLAVSGCIASYVSPTSLGGGKRVVNGSYRPGAVDDASIRHPGMC